MPSSRRKETPLRSLPLALFLALILVSPLAAARTERFVLDNGLTVLLREEHSSPILTMQCWVKAGSNVEGEFQGCGMSHFLEHMLFKGTKRRKVGDYAKEIQSYGGTLNAYTANDRTVYFFTIASAYFDKGLDALSDVIMNATLPADEAVKEQEVIRREIAMGEDSPGRQLWQGLMQAVYRSHPYRDPVIGYLPAYDTLDREKLKRYYEERYVPNNSIFCVVGDFDAAEARKKITKTFEAWKRRPLPMQIMPTEAPQISPRRIERPFHVKNSTCMAAWRGVPVTHPDVYAVDVLGLILGVGKTSRLHRRLKEMDQLVTSVVAHSWTPKDEGLILARMECDYGKVDRALAAMEEEVERVRNELIDPVELDRAKAKVISGAVNRLETIEGIADSIATGEFEVGDPEITDYYVKRIRSITAEDVRRVARRYLLPETRTVYVMHPMDEGPGKARVEGPAPKGDRAARIAALKARLLADSKGKAPRTEAGMGLSLGNTRLEKLRLANGMELIVMERPRLPLVAIAASFKGGGRYEGDRPAGISAFMTEMLVKGTKKHDADTLAAEMEAVGAELATVASPDLYGIRYMGLKDHLDLGLDTICEILSSASFPADEVEKMRTVQLAAIKTERDQAFRAASLDYARLRFPGHPYGRSNLGSPESVQKIDRAALAEYFQASCTPDNGIIAVVGDVKVEAIKAALDRRLRRWSGKARVSECPDSPSVTKKTVEQVPMEGRQQTIVFMGFEGCDVDSPDRYPLEVMNQAITGLGNRLFRNLRGKKSLAYQVGSGLSMGADRRSQRFFIATAPQRVDEALEGLLHEASLLREENLSPEEIERAKNRIIGSFAIDLQTNRSLAASMAYNELMGLGYRYSFGYAQKIQAVTADEIRDVARRYIVPEKRVVAIVGPKGK